MVVSLVILKKVLVDINKKEEMFKLEGNSHAEIINNLIIKLSILALPRYYHDNEDRLAEYCKGSLNWQIHKMDKSLVQDGICIYTRTMRFQ